MCFRSVPVTSGEARFSCKISEVNNLRLVVCRSVLNFKMHFNDVNNKAKTFVYTKLNIIEIIIYDILYSKKQLIQLRESKLINEYQKSTDLFIILLVSY